MDFAPRDIIAPSRVLGSDLIKYLSVFVGALVHNSNEALHWTRTTDVINPGRWCTTSLDRPTRWSPPERIGASYHHRVCADRRDDRSDQAQL
jgi:hypothetical protein